MKLMRSKRRFLAARRFEHDQADERARGQFTHPYEAPDFREARKRAPRRRQGPRRGHSGL